MMTKVMRLIFFIVFVRPLIHLLLGVNIINRGMLPQSGPAIIVANHNSHLDTLILMSILPVRLLPRIRPVAAASYFLRNPWLAWFSRNIIGIIPVSTGKGLGRHRVLKESITALQRGEILIIYPEGTRGKPEKLQPFKRGIAVLTTVLPEVPVYPVYLHGPGKVLAKGDVIPVPFVCSVMAGKPIKNKPGIKGAALMQQIRASMENLAYQGQFPAWE